MIEPPSQKILYKEFIYIYKISFDLHNNLFELGTRASNKVAE